MNFLAELLKKAKEIEDKEQQPQKQPQQHSQL